MWFKILDHFLKEYGRGPDFVADLTPDQLFIYVSGGKNPDAVANESEPEFMPPELFKAILRAELKGK